MRWLALGLAGLGLLACEERQGGAFAKRIESPRELIGGPAALGDVGDWIIGNGEFRAIVQDQGWSRGFGVFGGGIVDMDLVRPGAEGTDAGGTGRDNFGELFPALFLQAFDVAPVRVFDPATNKVVEAPAIEVLRDGADGGPAILRTRAGSGEFLTLLTQILDIAIPNDNVVLETDYIVRPGTRHVEITSRLMNNGGVPVPLDAAGLAGLLGLTGLQLPMGDVSLFAEGNTVFAPGGVGTEAGPAPVGFDLRFSVERSYATQASNGLRLPAVPGLVADFLATAGEDVSYGYAIADNERNFVWLNREAYGIDGEVPLSKHALLVPFLIDSFTGSFAVVPPPSLAPAGQEGSVFEVTRYVVVGHGDVASVREELFAIRGVTTGTLEGEVRNALTGAPEVGAWVHVLDARGLPYSQAEVDSHGRFRAQVEPGSYTYVVTAEGRFPFPETEAARAATSVRVAANGGAYRVIRIPPPPELTVSVRDETGRSLPAKVTVVGHADGGGQRPQDFLFDLWLGERRRHTNLAWRDGGALEYEEVHFYAPAGQAVQRVRPSRCTNAEGGPCDVSLAAESRTFHDYDVYVSRGPEYDVHVARGVRLLPGQRVSLEATLRRVVDTTHYIGVDTHIHSRNSVDAYVSLEEQVIQAAAEGLELMVGTDHNVVTDYQPVIAGLGLQDFVSSVVGVELTTLEMGHFNAFPLRYDLSAVTRFPFVDVCFDAQAQKTNHTGFDWVLCSPGQLFDQLRQLGSLGPEQTIVQVNHPRDTILGYFNQYYLNPYTAIAELPSAANYPEVSFFVYPQRNETGQFQPQQFSLDFDAVEVFNGKRLDQLHAFRLPPNAPADVVAAKQDYRCGDGHPQNGPGKVLLERGGYPAYPGAVDDWLHFLNRLPPDQAPTATGASDSHDLNAEVGSPRSYVYVPPLDDAPRDTYPTLVKPIDLVEGIKSRRVLVTNGPFVDMQVRTRAADAFNPPCSSFAQASACEREGCQWDGAVCQPPTTLWPVGSQVAFDTDARGTQLEFRFIVKSAPWVDVRRLRVWANAEMVAELEVPEGTHADGRALDDDVVIPWTRNEGFARDTVVVVEAYGDANLFPMVLPKEQPPANVGEALGGLIGGLGLSLDSFGAGDGVRAPTFIQAVRPYAITNPIWLDLDGDGTFDLPGNDVPVGPAPSEPCPNRDVAPRARTGTQVFFGQGVRATRFPLRDIRKLIPAYGGR